MTREVKRMTARRLRREGLTVREIAVRLGVPHSTVGDWVCGVDPERDCLLCGAATEGYSHFCCQQHQRKYWNVFGSRIYKKKAAA